VWHSATGKRSTNAEIGGVGRRRAPLENYRHPLSELPPGSCMLVWQQERRNRMTTSTFKPVKDRRKSAPVKRVTVSVDARKAYEDAIRQRDERERDHTRFLPDDRKGKR
jgi:hypothetical protein